MKQRITDHKTPFMAHARGSTKWGYWKKLRFAVMLILGNEIKWAFCTEYQACFTEKKEFLGLDYLGAKPQIVIGNVEMCDIQYMSTNLHLVIEETKKE